MDRSFAEPNVDVLWHGLQGTVAGLQLAGRLPATGQLYDARLDLVQDHLRRWGPNRSFAGLGASGIERALAEAARIGKRNQGASFLAFELIKAFCSAVGDEHHEAGAARRASDALQQAEKELAKQRKRQEQRRDR